MVKILEGFSHGWWHGNHIIYPLNFLGIVWFICWLIPWGYLKRVKEVDPNSYSFWLSILLTITPVIILGVIYINLMAEIHGSFYWEDAEMIILGATGWVFLTLGTAVTLSVKAEHEIPITSGISIGVLLATIIFGLIAVIRSWV